MPTLLAISLAACSAAARSCAACSAAACSAAAISATRRATFSTGVSTCTASASTVVASARALTAVVVAGVVASTGATAIREAVSPRFCHHSKPAEAATATPIEAKRLEHPAPISCPRLALPHRSNTCVYNRNFDHQSTAGVQMTGERNGATHPSPETPASRASSSWAAELLVRAPSHPPWSGSVKISGGN